MSWTYSGDPSTNPRDDVRFALGDTTNTKHSLTDEEIDYLVRENSTIVGAKIAAAEALSARHSAISATSKSVGDLTISYEHGQTAARYDALAVRFRARSGPRTFAPLMVDAPSIFEVGMDDYAE